MLELNRPDPVRSALIDEARGARIRHGFFTRKGGISDGIYAGLNTGVGSYDDPETVGENRRRVAQWLGVAPDRLLTPYQIHSADVAIVSAPFTGERPRADAIVTATPGLAVAVGTADCGPVLFADAEAGVVGAAHAGWKGAIGGVLEATIEAMETLGADRKRIVATLGPSISQPCYEVGSEFVTRFVQADPANDRYFLPSSRADHAMFDLNRYTVDRLVAAGVTADCVGRCTYAEEESFFSYRRTTHRGEPDYGRQISAIVLETR